LRLLILSDIHYPFTEDSTLLDILREEKSADKVIFLGDNVRDDSKGPQFLDLIKKTRDLKDVIFIRGNHDGGAIPCADSVEFVQNGKKFTFMHGDQFKVGSEGSTHRLASILKKINPKLPVVAFASVARIKHRNKPEEYLILGHSHALVFFPRLRVACAGCLTTESSFYNERGYIVLASEGKEFNLTLISLGSVSDSTGRRIPGINQQNKSTIISRHIILLFSTILCHSRLAFPSLRKHVERKLGRKDRSSSSLHRRSHRID
jgi:uncharacterized protein